mmetsp:Transcript_496/g.1820  ORF Transcript_496/g.1820 Transcript_496/m.1820 type:complete len:678 (-) Transcript_496:145-2178(-)
MARWRSWGRRASCKSSCTSSRRTISRCGWRRSRPHSSRTAAVAAAAARGQSPSPAPLPPPRTSPTPSSGIQTPVVSVRTPHTRPGRLSRRSARINSGLSPAKRRADSVTGVSVSPQLGECVITVIRLRPRLTHELTKDKELGLSVSIEPPGRVVLSDPQQNKETRIFDCDLALDSSDPELPGYSDQQAVYHHVGEQLVDRALQGYNCCLCAYGQTGTGKTHTLHGDWSNTEQRGLLPRIAAALLSQLEALRAGGAEVRLQASFIEIYNNRLHDLLAPADTSRTPAEKKLGKLEIHTHPAVGIFVANLSEITVQNMNHVGRLVATGERLRHTAQTSMNARSSRSHTIFSFKMEVRDDVDSQGNQDSKMATVQVVDLAGRENEQTSECIGDRFKEMTFINRSLFHLANCISALSDGNREHVPFRNSKLTMLLSESFQRNSKTYLLATLTPSASGYDENLLTCRFLESTGRITTQPMANQFSSEDVASQLKDEIESMRMQLGYDAMAAAPSEQPELNSRQHLLNYLSSNAWAMKVAEARGPSPAGGVGVSPARRGAAREELWKQEEEATQAVILDACGYVERRLADASRELGRLDASRATVGASLGKAEKQLNKAVLAVRELRPGYDSAGRGPEQSGERGGVVTLPPLVPVGGKLPKENMFGRPSPSVTFSIELPPIIML